MQRIGSLSNKQKGLSAIGILGVVVIIAYVILPSAITPEISITDIDSQIDIPDNCSNMISVDPVAGDLAVRGSATVEVSFTLVNSDNIDGTVIVELAAFNHLADQDPNWKDDLYRVIAENQYLVEGNSVVHSTLNAVGGPCNLDYDDLDLRIAEIKPA